MADPLQISVRIPAWVEDPDARIGRPVLEGAQRAMTATLRKHFRGLNASRPNARGWKRTNWWNRVASSVTSGIEGNAAVAEIREPGVRLHWKGGTVRPQNARALAIPADPDVAGVWPSEYRGEPGRAATFLAWPKGKAYGFIAERKPKGSKDRALHVLWWLKAETHHEADPDVIPEEDLHAAVEKACRDVAGALRKGGKA